MKYSLVFCLILNIKNMKVYSLKFNDKALEPFKVKVSVDCLEISTWEPFGKAIEKLAHMRGYNEVKAEDIDKLDFYLREDKVFKYKTQQVEGHFNVVNDRWEGITITFSSIDPVWKFKKEW
jgi:hypothetical protein